jgi:uncharacterized membrane protein
MPSIWLVGVSLVLVTALATVQLAWLTRQREPQARVEPRDKSVTERKRRQDAWHLYMQIVVSLALLGVGLYVILSKQYQSADTNWAYGTVGTVIGFWLKGK